MQNNKKEEPIEEVFKNKNIAIEIPFKHPQKIIDEGYVITKIALSNLSYDENWNIIEGNIQAMVMSMEDYMMSVMRM